MSTRDSSSVGQFAWKGASLKKSVLAITSALVLVSWSQLPLKADERPSGSPLSEATKAELEQLYKKLIEAENVHDLETVRSMLLASPDSLFISRLEPIEKGDWGGYWGTESIMEHFAALYSGTFRIDPNYAEEKTVGLTSSVAETYAPVVITSGYGGQAPVGRSFLMVLEWVRTADGWRVATDIPLPIPPAPTIHH